MGVRERVWPARTSRATSETARPVGTGCPGKKVGSGTNPVGDRGRYGALAIRPVGIGEYPVSTNCCRCLATRPLVVRESASTARQNEEVLKLFMLLGDKADGDRDCKCGLMNGMPWIRQ